MSNWLKLWRGAGQPLETGPQPENVIRLYRGAVEPLIPFESMSAKITGEAADCNEIPLIGLGEGIGAVYLQDQMGVSIAHQAGGFIEVQASFPIPETERQTGVLAGVSLTGVLNR